MKTEKRLLKSQKASWWFGQRSIEAPDEHVRNAKAVNQFGLAGQRRERSGCVAAEDGAWMRIERERDWHESSLFGLPGGLCKKELVAFVHAVEVADHRDRSTNDVGREVRSADVAVDAKGVGGHFFRQM